MIEIYTPRFWLGHFRFTNEKEIKHWPQIEEQLEALLLGWA